MHDSKDEYAIGFDAEQHAVGKTVDEAPANLVIDFRPHGRVIDSVLESGIDFSGEVYAKTGIASLVVCDSLDKLLVRFRME